VADVSLCVAGPADRDQVIAVLAAADLGSRQPALIEFVLRDPGIRVVIARVDGVAAGTAHGISLGDTGWLGNVAVRPDVQRRGIGTAVTRAAVDWMREQGARTVLLLATPAGRPVYERLGFVVDGEPVDKYTIAAAPRPLGPTGVRSGSLDDSARLDRVATGEARERLLAPFADRLVAPLAGDGGYALTLPWGGGPVIADEPDAAHALWWHAYASRPGARWAFPRRNFAAAELARRYGCAYAGESVRMRLGPPVALEPARVWAVWSLATG